MRSPFPGSSCPRTTGGGHSGSVTAEFAAVMPAVILVLACCLGSLQLAVRQLSLQTAAASIARTVAREGTGAPRIAELIERLTPGARIETVRRGELICIRLSSPGSALPGLGGIMVNASSCAWADAR